MRSRKTKIVVSDQISRVIIIIDISAAEWQHKPTKQLPRLSKKYITSLFFASHFPLPLSSSTDVHVDFLSSLLLCIMPFFLYVSVCQNSMSLCFFFH